MRNRAAILLSLSVLVLFCGCSGAIGGGAYLKSYELVQPAGSSGRVFESQDMLVRVDIIDDSVYRLRIKNKTSGRMRVFWKNSTAQNAQGSQVGLGAVVTDGTGGDGVCHIEPGGEITARVFPLENAYTADDGSEGHYPLYSVGPHNGRATDLDDRLIGVRLVMGIGNSTRLYPFMLKVSPSFFSM